MTTRERLVKRITEISNIIAISSREKKMVEYLEETFKNTSIDINAVSALLTAGIYYLTLHSPCAPFCGIDINTEEGFKRIETSLEKLTHILFNLQGWK